MARRVQGGNGTANVVLPGGWVLDAGDIVVIPDAEWDQIKIDDFLSSRIDDLGYTSDLPISPPSFRDIQRTVLEGSTGVDTRLDDLSAALGAHTSDTTDVHGIADTAKLGWLQSVTAPSGAASGTVLTKTGASAYAFSPPAPGVVKWEQTYNFAVASTDWLISHGQGTKSIHVEVENGSGQPMEAKVVYVDTNTIRIEHYYPESGSARLWTTT